MLAAIGGTFTTKTLKWVSADSFITATEGGLCLWQMDKSLTRALWQYKSI